MSGGLSGYDATMTILTVPELATWVREPIAEGDEYAILLVRAVTALINSRAFGVDETTWLWTDPANTPSRVRDIAAIVAKRNWLNPDQVQHEGSIGPIGGDTYVAEFAAGLTLTEAEESEILTLAGSAPAHEGAGRISVMSFGTGRGSRGGTIYVGDDSGSDWKLPLVDTSQDTFYQVDG